MDHEPPVQQGSYPPTAADAYDAMAPIYDRFNEANDYEVWLGQVLLPELEKHGLGKGWALDVGCGTGRAFESLLRRGWSIFGCDSSEGMIHQAAGKHQEALKDLRLHLAVGDARELPELTMSFDLVLLLNDVVNYLTEDGDLEKCFSGVKRNLAEGGLVCFDANSLSVYEQSWLAGSGETMRERGWEWEGLSAAAIPGEVFEAEVGGPGVESSVHRQRHWPRRSIEDAMESAGLECLTVLGQREEGDDLALDEVPCEELHYKLIYIAKAK